MGQTISITSIKEWHPRRNGEYNKARTTKPKCICRQKKNRIKFQGWRKGIFQSQTKKELFMLMEMEEIRTKMLWKL